MVMTVWIYSQLQSNINISLKQEKLMNYSIGIPESSEGLCNKFNHTLPISKAPNVFPYCGFCHIFSTWWMQPSFIVAPVIVADECLTRYDCAWWSNAPNMLRTLNYGGDDLEGNGDLESWVFCWVQWSRLKKGLITNRTVLVDRFLWTEIDLWFEGNRELIDRFDD